MSYPFVGIQGVWPEYEKWDAAAIEQALRDGRHIYLEDGVNQCVVKFDKRAGMFQVGVLGHEELAYETPAFLELCAWVAFYGMDIL